ncbi:anchored repeat-type ABC transporter ATP-binding subunit [Corynebacterium sp. HS2168-gen11]|uniref:anchored repeat-type ABC transporter ATP-binding subunit n=1 Tax=Corynebacterium sp. HS2168-gen11 TaxID=2974027 RepID=UPI00216B13AA|nr:anchored repeat-type ABC transporter ATP-binding subunit [Corynebacterium sp. HS2168-gen11]MCS4535011.1 anchored repeat-type ABC transporter ATP-binding subunit [Corynebacterium sp. HS2168-gen11]
MSLVVATNLGVKLAGREIFREVDFSVAKGEFVGLLGPNGAGKTTLMRALLQLVPASGTVEVAGQRQVKAIRSMIGYVPQRHEFAWDFPISIRQAVRNGRTGLSKWYQRSNADDEQAVTEALERVGLVDLADRPIGQLSGGQRQRVLVARALSTRPKVLLLDEPFTGLDMPTAEQLTSLFQKLAAQGTSIVMSTHDIGEALHACDRLVLFREGIRADGSPQQLADPHLWMDTFEVGPQSPLLSLVGAHLS